MPHVIGWSMVRKETVRWTLLVGNMAIFKQNDGEYVTRPMRSADEAEELATAFVESDEQIGYTLGVEPRQLEVSEDRLVIMLTGDLEAIDATFTELFAPRAPTTGWGSVVHTSSARIVPHDPPAGALVYDTSKTVLKVFNGAEWVELKGMA